MRAAMHSYERGYEMTSIRFAFGKSFHLAKPYFDHRPFHHGTSTVNHRHRDLRHHRRRPLRPHLRCAGNRKAFQGQCGVSLVVKGCNTKCNATGPPTTPRPSPHTERDFRIGTSIGCCVSPFCIGRAWATEMLGQGNLAGAI